MDKFIKEISKDLVTNMFYELKEILMFLFQKISSIYFSDKLNYFATFSLVGVILNAIGLPRGKAGYIIGKILYFMINKLWDQLF